MRGLAKPSRSFSRVRVPASLSQHGVRRKDEPSQTRSYAMAAEPSLCVTDVTVANDHRNLIDQTVRAFGRLDLAFNNAGTEQFGQSIVKLPEEEWDRVLAINMKGVFLGMKDQIPAMLMAGDGLIVNTSSVGGLVATPEVSAYQTSKHGLIRLTKVAAMECATRISRERHLPRRYSQRHVLPTNC